MDTNRTKVLQCIIDLKNSQRPASRVLIGQYLNIRLSVVDEAVKRLKEDGLVRTIVPGFLEPVSQWRPDRAMSKTVLPDGMTKLEIGDTCEELTPHEAQVLGKMFHGEAVEMAYWYEERRQGEQMVKLEAEVRMLRRQLHGMNHRLAHARIARDQHDLFTESDPLPAKRRTTTPA